MGDWGCGIGHWAQSPIPNPQSPSPIPIIYEYKVQIIQEIYIWNKGYI